MSVTPDSPEKITDDAIALARNLTDAMRKYHRNEVLSKPAEQGKPQEYYALSPDGQEEGIQHNAEAIVRLMRLQSVNTKRFADAIGGEKAPAIVEALQAIEAAEKEAATIVGKKREEQEAARSMLEQKKKAMVGLLTEVLCN